MAPSPLERFARRTTALAERWVPDAFVFALAATLVVVVAGWIVDPAARVAPLRIVDAWGNGFWTLIPFTLQMAMIIIGGYVLASSPPVHRAIVRLAGWPTTAKGAVVLVALAAMLTSLVNWGFSLIFGAMLAREIARRVRSADYRALGASSVLGLGTVWAQGLSGSAALQMARASSMPPALARMVGGGIPLTATIFRWQSMLCVAIEIAVVAALMWAIAPSAGAGRSAASLGVDLGEADDARTAQAPDSAGSAPAVLSRPGDRFDHSPILLVPVVALGFIYLARVTAGRAATAADALNAIDFNTINLFFLMLGALLHWRPSSLMRAAREATPATWGVLLQFPFYGGIFGIMTGLRLSDAIASLFVRASTPTLYPAMIVAYSAVLGIFVPSGGSKWVIEAPYVLQAARALAVPDGWMVVTYNLGEAIANLLQPFWMLPVLALLGLRARDIMGYTYLVALVLLPVVIVLVTVFRPLA
jgi:short-chain fatty acids transporter